MKFGHRVSGTVQAYDEKGRGTFELEGRKVEGGYQEGSGQIVVPFTAVGDTVTATFVKRDHGTKVARLESVDTPSPDRTATRCAHAGRCGGCLWQHLSYEAQLGLKRDFVNRAFAGAGHEERVGEVTACPPGPGETTFRSYFRNRMDYAVGWTGEIGLKEYDAWNRYVDVQECWLLAPEAGAILAAVRAWMPAYDLQPWDAKFHTGDIRYVLIREGKRTSQRLIVLVVKDAKRLTTAAKDALREALSPFATSLLVGEQALATDLSLAQSFETLKGEPWFEEEAGGIRYRIHPNSFFQTNTVMAERLQEAVLRLLGDAPSKRLLDLYCGLGFFGIAAAKQRPGWEIAGFEIDAEAITLASQNAEANGVGERCCFEAGPAESLAWKDWTADAVILDPPRAGLHPKVLAATLTMAPKEIVYVSCNYKRFVEDWKALKETYACTALEAYDLFPHTPHVELVAKLERKS